MSEIILHHYPQSPVSEKVRAGLGIKKVTWRSVEIPRLPPKPDLMPLTGGYRRTPVMQIGADIFCDSECILRALDQRVPEPAFYLDTPDIWDPGDLFDLIFRLVLVFTGDSMPPGFVEDRGRLYLGPEWNMAEISAQIPEVIRNIRDRFRSLNDVLLADRPFLGGVTPNASDANAYHLVWFLRGRWADGPALLSEMPHLVAWEHRMAHIGHGIWTDMTSHEALEIARDAEPATPALIHDNDPLELTVGQPVTVAPDGDGGDPEVSGTVHFADGDTIAIVRQDDQIGTVCVHFPRAGYRVAIK